jgi:hypothetical protein
VSEEPKVSYLFDPNEKLKPGETMFDRMKRMGPLKDKLDVFGEKVMEGPGTTQDTVTFHPAMVAAKKMEKKIHDQLEESGANKQSFRDGTLRYRYYEGSVCYR